VTVRVREVALYVRPAATRLPFRFGIGVMREAPQLFLRALVEVDGQAVVGVAAEGLVPKWFVKDPKTDLEQDRHALLASVGDAMRIATDLPAQPDVFSLWLSVHGRQLAAAGAGVPPLLAGLGPSLVERAVIDACCRRLGVPFAVALRGGALGLRLDAVHPNLRGMQVADLLPATPSRRLAVRHTVGFDDPLTPADVDDIVDDGLPQTLEACVQSTGVSYFKVKLSGQQDDDLARLRDVVGVLGRCADPSWRMTLDGNEQYGAIDNLRALWERMAGDTAVGAALPRVLFVEQPLRRDVALSDAAATAIKDWPHRPPLIIDESDALIDSLPRALVCGYAGTSYKSCKGVLRGIANGCLLAAMRHRQPERRVSLSAEDLTNVGPVALIEDLAVVATLGLAHVERNGHHYFRGLSMFPQPIQDGVIRHHGDLYRRHERGFATLAIERGQIDVGSVIAAPFGPAFAVDPVSFADPIDASARGASLR
jgi:hypothetical protein